MYKNVRYVVITEPNPLGTSPCRAIAASLRRDEKYFLSIDAHMIFKNNWDEELIKGLTELKEVCEKPIITTYTPFWYKDEDNIIHNQEGGLDLDKVMPVMSLRFKQETEMGFGEFVLPTPTWDKPLTERYKEHYLLSAHLLFAEMSFLEDVPFDPMLTYYEENTAALRAWTRGYRMFALNKDVMWAREMFRGKDVKNSWRSKLFESKDSTSSYYTRLVKGTIRCKKILLGDILGLFGAPTKESIKAYELAAGIDHLTVYKRMYDERSIRVGYSTPIKDMYVEENSCHKF